MATIEENWHTSADSDIAKHSIDNLNVIELQKHVMQRVKTASILNRFQLATKTALKRIAIPTPNPMTLGLT